MARQSDEVDLTWVGQMQRTREMLERWNARRAKEPPTVHRSHPEDRRPTTETMATAIARKTKTTRKKVRRG